VEGPLGNGVEKKACDLITPKNMLKSLVTFVSVLCNLCKCSDSHFVYKMGSMCLEKVL
jgi:hypothetical protein